MTFDQIWQQLCRKDSALNDPASRIEFTSSNLQQLLQQVYEQGKKMGQQAEKLQAKVSGSNAFDPFKEMFGR